jgi:hypothetical protein
MSERLIYLRESDAKELLKTVEKMLGYWVSSGTVPHHKCAFCYRLDDMRGKLKHSDNCSGVALLTSLKKKIEDLDKEMDVVEVARLMELEDADSTACVSAIRWLANYANHGMETRTVVRAIRSLKEKLGIPF